MSKRFSLLKILVVVFVRGGESSNDSILIFFGDFFDRSSSVDDCYFLSQGTGRGSGRKRRSICIVGAGRSHVSFLSAAETTSFFEAFVSFLRSKFLWSFIDVDVHGIGIPSGSALSGGGGMESDWSPGRMLLGDREIGRASCRERVSPYV